MTNRRSFVLGLFITASFLCTSRTAWGNSEINTYTKTDFAMDTVVSETLYTTGEDITADVISALKDVEDKSSQNEDSYSNTVKTVIRIYDHVNLASQQVSETIKSTKETTENLEKRVKLVNEKLDNSQREYVAILGIFATVVVTFMGGMMFTSSTLTGMAQVSIYRLIGMIALLGFVLFNLSLLLIRFLLLITGNIQREQVGKDVFSLNLLQWNKFSFIEKMNTVFVFLFIGTFIMWLLNCRGMGTLFLQIFGRKL